MSDKIKKFSDCGIIVGRFQVPSLTEAHTKLIESVKERHEKVIIFLGVCGISPVPSTKRNPLDYEMRKQMIDDKFGGMNVIVSYVKDMKYDIAWSKQLDDRIADLTSPKQSVVLYGGRDSFIKYYLGKHETEELEPEVYVKISGSEVRDSLKNKVGETDAFRAGVIWANENQYDHALCVIDAAVFNEDYTKILLGKRDWEKEYRFFGGFVDVTRDKSLEMATRREVKEEAGIEITDPIYVCSKQISDWRYKNEKDKVYTTFFAAKYLYGSITPGDDIDECKWVDITKTHGSYILSENLVAEHTLLFEELLKKMDKIK